MNKLIKVLIAFIVVLSLFPASFSANTNEDNTGTANEAAPETEKEVNELGIEAGTIVNGEDISELTEEELQYVPEGLRDGEGESEHQHEEEGEMYSTFASYPDVNNYILSKNLSTAKMEYDHKSHFTRFNYRYGYGKVEGVVAHETANSNSTITGEISYMSRNHKNAFVHAFVDHQRIIEIHPTELGAWGGGRYANERFVHVELVRVHSFDHFARSINNYSDYIAKVLYKYNLGVNSADSDGRGTLWSHRAVSNFLGGTNHVDPYGYFAKWGYEWNDFVDLVTRKYNAQASTKESVTSKLGHIRSSSVKLYPNLAQQSEYNTAGSTYTNAVYYIKKEASYNGQKYYLLSTSPSSTRNLVGWAKASDINAREHLVADKNSKSFYLKGRGSSYGTAWGGSKNIVQKELSESKGELFKVHLTETVGGSVWYRGELNGKTQWIHSSDVTAAKEAGTSKLGHIRSSSVKLYPVLGENSSAVTAGSTYTHAVYYIKKEATINSQKYYLLSTSPSSTRNLVGWAKAEDINAQTHVAVNYDSKTFYLKGTGSANDTAWGGAKNRIYSDLSSYKDEEFKVHLTESVGDSIWYRGELNGKTVWIHSKYVEATKEVSTSMLGHIRSSKVEIYPALGNDSSITAGSTYTNAVYYIKKEALYNGQKYYLLSQKPSSTRGIVGWAKAEDMTAYKHVGVDKKDKTFYVKGTSRAYGTAWGGDKDVIYSDLSKYKGDAFKVHLTETVGTSKWYRGVLDGRTVWIRYSELDK